MTTETKPTLEQATATALAAAQDQIHIASAIYGLQESIESGDAQRLQNTANRMQSYIQGYAAGQRWAVEAIFHALVQDGFVEKSPQASAGLYLIEAVLHMHKSAPVISAEVGGELH